MKKLFDLRFVIGAFFLLIGVLLVCYGFTTSFVASKQINQGCGGIFIGFALFMLVLSFRKSGETGS